MYPKIKDYLFLNFNIALLDQKCKALLFPVANRGDRHYATHKQKSQLFDWIGLGAEYVKRTGVNYSLIVLQSYSVLIAIMSQKTRTKWKNTWEYNGCCSLSMAEKTLAHLQSQKFNTQLVRPVWQWKTKSLNIARPWNKKYLLYLVPKKTPFCSCIKVIIFFGGGT